MIYLFPFHLISYYFKFMFIISQQTVYSVIKEKILLNIENINKRQFITLTFNNSLKMF